MPFAPIVETDTPKGQRKKRRRQAAETKHVSSPFASPGVVDDLAFYIYPVKTVVVVDGWKKVIPSAIRTLPEGPLARVKAFARSVSEPGFRVTAYPRFRYGRNRIKVELSGGRTGTKHVWKIAKTCDTEAEAITYIHEAKHALVKHGGPK